MQDRNLLFETITPPNPALPRLRAGDRAAWSYPVGAYAGYTLAYCLTGPAAFEIPVTEAAGVFTAALSSAITRALAPGQYIWILTATKNGERDTLAQGVVDVDPDIAGVTAPIDLRTHARRVLDAIESVLEGRASSDAAQITIANRHIVKTPLPELLTLRDRYKAEVTREDALTGRTPFRNKIYVRFAR